MLVLFETPAGYSLFKVTNEKKWNKTDVDEIPSTFFGDSAQALKSLELVDFQPFSDTADAVAAATALMEGKVTKSLKSFLKKPTKSSALCVADKALGAGIKEALSGATVVHDAKTMQLFRGIRCYMEELLEASSPEAGGGSVPSGKDIRAMQLGLSHSLGRYKLKFSADKVDTMVIQAVGLLDELDKEINTYAMRVKEWYGWHFPELQGLVGENAKYAKLVLQCGMRPNYAKQDLSTVLEDETLEASVKEAAELSMGTEVADMDILHISSLAEQVLSMTEYRAQLFEYLKNRMNAIAPNLTILVGELVGARLIAHAGSLINLAKQPASTVQILGAEKALFRALKTKHDTPKYGLIYHASLVGQAAPKHKGKVSRVLAAKAALAIRVDALTDDTTADTMIGFEGRAKVEARLRQLEGGSTSTPMKLSSSTNGALSNPKTARYDPVAAKAIASSGAPSYNDARDMVLDGDAKAATPEVSSEKKKSKKEKKSDKKSEKKAKKKRKAEKDAGEDDDDDDKAARKAAKKAKKEKRKSRE